LELKSLDDELGPSLHKLEKNLKRQMSTWIVP